jgi:FKBP-type peptidyl-prolyl cis-trans isomerase FkpA
VKTIVRSTLAVALALAGCTPQPPTPKTDEDKTLYAIGVAVNRQVEVFHLTPAEAELVVAGFRDAAAGKATIKVEEKMPDIQKLAQARAQAASGAMAAKGPAYLEAAAKEAGAVKTETGLVYIPVKEGTGESPKATDQVKVLYTGKLVDGTVFDSSAKHGGQPVTFPLNGVIPCWTQGVQKMKVGGKARLVCPPEIAYGETGAPGGVIPPKSTLDFEVELLEIMQTPTEKPAAPAVKPPGHK